MKRKMVLGLALLGMASMLCGFDSAETADTVLQKMQESEDMTGGVSMDMGLNCDASLLIGDGTTTSSLAILVTADLNMAETLDPLAMEMEGNVNISALTESEAMEIRLYSVTNEEGTLETYIYTKSGEEDGVWEYEASEDIDLSSLTTQLESADVSSLSDWGITFELAEEAADVDGTECYLLTSSLDANTIMTVLEQVSALSGEDVTSDEEVSAMLALLDGIVIRLEYYVDTTSYQPVKIHMDLNDSDFSILNSYIASMLLASESDSTTTIELAANDLSCDVLLSYGSVDEITIPEEAIAAVAAQVEDTAEEAISEAADAAEEAVSEAADTAEEAVSEAADTAEEAVSEAAVG